jgi:hypothetical protein
LRKLPQQCPDDIREAAGFREWHDLGTQNT